MDELSILKVVGIERASYDNKSIFSCEARNVRDDKTIVREIETNWSIATKIVLRGMEMETNAQMNDRTSSSTN